MLDPQRHTFHRLCIGDPTQQGPMGFYKSYRCGSAAGGWHWAAACAWGARPLGAQALLCWVLMTAHGHAALLQQGRGSGWAQASG